MAKKTVLYKLGIWIAEAAVGGIECYSPGEIFIKAKNNRVRRLPRYLGEKSIPQREGEDLLKVIDIVSQEMRKTVNCERVYLVCLCEGDKLGLHFRLLPRYESDKGFLDELDTDVHETNDGLALMARWRKQYLLKKKCPNRKPFAELRKKHKEAIKKVTEGLHKRALTSKD
jgi:diadenosine tetraphosphate (Ap4A) HIT family hydrolase